MTETTGFLRQDVARAFTPLTRDHGFTRNAAHCNNTCETFAGDGFWVRASRDRKLYVDVAGASDTDSWFNVLNVIHFLTGQDPRNGDTLGLSATVGLVVGHLDLLHHSFSAERLRATKQRLKRMREDHEWKRWL